MANDKKHLIYTAVGGNNYANVTNLCTNSLKNHLKRTDVDILVITDKYTYNISNNLVYRINFDCHPALYRLYIYDYPDINKYDKILYVDSDILAVKNIDNIFDENLLENRLYTYNCGNDYHDHVVFWLKYSEKEIEQMMNNKSLPFSSGQFMFRYSEKMMEHFKNITTSDMIKIRRNMYHDQSIINHYFNSNLINCCEILDNYFLMFATRNTSPDINKPFLHFCGFAFESDFKINEMINYIKINDPSFFYSFFYSFF